MRWLTPPFPNMIFLQLILEPLPLLAQPAFCMLLLATSIPKAFGMNGLFMVLRAITARPTPPFPNQIFRMLRHFCMLLLAAGTLGRFLALCTFAALISSNFHTAPRLSMAWQTNLYAPRRSVNMMFVPFRRAEWRMMRMTLRPPPPVNAALCPTPGTLHPALPLFPLRFLPSLLFLAFCPALPSYSPRAIS